MTQPDIAARIAAAEELHAKATPGEWRVSDKSKSAGISCDECGAEYHPAASITAPSTFGEDARLHIATITRADRGDPDASSIVALHNLFPDLVADWERKEQRIDTLEAENERIRTELRRWFGCPSCGERHDGICPPHEMRTTGQAWFYRALSEAKQREDSLRRRVAELE